MQRLLAILIAASIPGCGGGTADGAAPDSRPVPAATTQQGETQSPEDAVKTFLIAVAESDEAAIKGVAIESPGIEILWAGKPLPEPLRRQFVETLKAVQPKRLQVGQAITLPTSHGPVTLTLDANDINDGRTMILLGDLPLPNVVVKRDGVWKVDPGSLIAARQAARRFRMSHTRPADQ